MIKVDRIETILEQQTVCNIINANKDRHLFRRITPIQNHANTTLAFDLTQTKEMAEIPIGSSVSIHCEGWLIHTPRGGPRTMPLSYTLSDPEHNLAASWVMEPMGYGDDNDDDRIKPSSHKALIIFIMIFTLFFIGAAGYGGWLLMLKKRRLKKYQDDIRLSSINGPEGDYSQIT